MKTVICLSMIDNHTQQQPEPRLGRSSPPRPAGVARYLSPPRDLGNPIATCEPVLSVASLRSTGARWALLAGRGGIGKRKQRLEAAP